jgi:2-iminobutanoate/2-iminopropanoate deaminase
MSTMRHLASPIAKSFSEALRIDTEAGSWIFVSGQVGVAIPPNNKPISFEQEVRVTFDRIRESLRKLDADMDKIVSIKVYLTDLAPYAEFSKVRGEVFPHNPPTSSAVQVAGLLLGARIEIDAVALSPRGETR